MKISIPLEKISDDTVLFLLRDLGYDIEGGPPVLSYDEIKRMSDEEIKKEGAKRYDKYMERMRGLLFKIACCNK